MNSRFSLALIIGCATLLRPATSQLHASTVTNGGFETGDLTGWTFTAAATGSNFYVGEPAYEGNNAAVFGAGTPGQYDTISQTVATQAGRGNYLTFFLTDEGTPSPDGANFEVFWDGSLILDVPGSTSFNYTGYNLLLSGSGSDTLSFSGYNVDSFYALDNVSVAPTPEPGTVWLLGSGLLGVAATVRRKLRN